MVSEMNEKSHWVQNIRRDKGVSFSVDERTYEGDARVVDPEKESELVARVRRLMDTEYNWSQGMIVELQPRTGLP